MLMCCAYETVSLIRQNYPNDYVVYNSSMGVSDWEISATVLDIASQTQTDRELCAFYSSGVAVESDAIQVGVSLKKKKKKRRRRRG